MFVLNISHIHIFDVLIEFIGIGFMDFNQNHMQSAYK